MTCFPCCTATSLKADALSLLLTSHEEWPMANPTAHLIKPLTVAAMPNVHTSHLQLGTFKKTPNALSYQTSTAMKYDLCGPRDGLEERTPMLTLHRFHRHLLSSLNNREHGRQAVEVLQNKYSYICRQLLGTQLKRSHLFSNCTLRLGRDEISIFVK